jgi:hypothetical protein
MHTTRKASKVRLGLAAGAAAALTAGVVLAATSAGADSTSASPAARGQHNPHSLQSRQNRPTAFVAHDTLTVRGTNGRDALALRLAAGDPNTLEVDFGDDGSAELRFDRATFGSIEVSLGSGSDRFRVDQVNGAFADEALTVLAGSGDDTMDGGDGVETFYGESGADAVDGNRGNDIGILGTGGDSFRWDPGDGSDVVEGGTGNDTLDFNGANVAENMQLVPNGRRSLFLRDVANIRMDMDDVEQLDLTALGANDTVTVGDMRGTDFRLANVDLSAATGGGDGAVDTVIVNGTERRDDIDVRARRGAVEVTGLQTTTRITGSEPTDHLQVNALGGNDDVDVQQAARNLIDVIVDLGTGQY